MKGVDEVLTRTLAAQPYPRVRRGQRSRPAIRRDRAGAVPPATDGQHSGRSVAACLPAQPRRRDDGRGAGARFASDSADGQLPGGRPPLPRKADDALAGRCAGALEGARARAVSDAEYAAARNTCGSWLSRSGLYAFYGCQPYGSLRQANLRLLCEKAVEHQTRGGGLQAFLNSVVSVTAARESVSPTVLSPKEDVVRVMSIHKSKGLEFPVVFLMGLEAGFESAGTSALKAHQRLGVALPYIDEVRRVKSDTLLSAAVDLRRKTENLAERARVLYVGMTRARDELILMGCTETPRFTPARLSAYGVSSAGNMLQWLAACVDPAVDSFILADPAVSTISTSFPHKQGGFSVVSHNSADETVDLLHLAQPKSDRESLARQQSRLEALTGEARSLARELRLPGDPDADPLAPDIRRDHRPFKVGVTALVRALRETAPEPPRLVDPEGDDPAEMETVRLKRLPLPLTRPRQIADLPRYPAFMREPEAGPQGILRGVAMHKALCLLSYAPLRALEGEQELRLEIRRQLQEFLTKRLFTEEEFQRTDVGALASFFQSEWGRGALAAETVKREWGFVLALPEEDGMLVQGVIDLCYLQDGQWMLLDYKTDAVDHADALWPLYEAQTALYRRALAEVTGIPVRSVTLYALALGAGTTHSA